MLVYIALFYVWSYNADPVNPIIGFRNGTPVISTTNQGGCPHTQIAKSWDTPSPTAPTAPGRVFFYEDIQHSPTRGVK